MEMAKGMFMLDLFISVMLKKKWGVQHPATKNSMVSTTRQIHEGAPSGAEGDLTNPFYET